MQTSYLRTTPASLSKVPWRRIVGLRNHIIHAYRGIETEIIWQTATVELPKLLQLLGL
ncbi:MAG: DUF86 domain-containing protein [Oligoflexales bacterium]|nr:DUF86 domain-containing protein [Oligoflexales bacterium]